jgi:hypothetical protein
MFSTILSTRVNVRGERMKISKNLGLLDRTLRVIASSIIIYFGFFDNSLIADPFVGNAVGLFGVANLVVALVGFCPLYTLFSFSTCKDTLSEAGN